MGPEEHGPVLATLSPPAPPTLLQPGAQQIAAPAQLSTNPKCAPLQFIRPHITSSKRKRPQCIAHRGYKSKYPENTMSAFRAATNAGAHAIETDLQITKDDVVVLSHDPNLKRCFGKDIKIADCSWDVIKDLRTIEKPHERLPRLADLLHYLTEEASEDIWTFLDIKLNNDADKIMQLIASTLKSNPSLSSSSWDTRIVLGIWSKNYLPPAQTHLPGFPVMHIAFSTTYARQFLEVENVGFNMMFYALLMPGGKKFLHDAQKVHNRKVLSWTINGENNMRWCIRRGIDGVVTDEVEKYLELTERFDEDEEKEPWFPVGLKMLLNAVKTYVYVKVLLVFYSTKKGLAVSRASVGKEKGKE